MYILLLYSYLGKKENKVYLVFINLFKSGDFLNYNIIDKSSTESTLSIEEI